MEREKRENERKEKEELTKRVAAAKVIQRWWKRRERNKQCRTESWQWWEAQRKAKFDIIDFLQFLGFYCFLTGKTPDSNRLKIVVKYLTTNKFGKNNIPYFTLLIDMRYMARARKYLEVIIMQCIQTSTNSNDLTSFGPELTFLLQYLNPKTYQTKHMIDPYHVIDIPDKILSSFGQSILKTTLCQFNLRSSFILCVQEIIKLEERSTKDVTRIKAMKLWLTTMTRLTLFPIEHAEATSDALDTVTAAHFLWTNTLAVPYITCLISTMMVDRLRPWALNTMPLLLKQMDLISIDLSGNGALFLLANLIELLKSDQLVELTTSLIVYIEPYFSDRQTPSYPHYHPIFKWSKATWGNTIPSIVFDKVMKQIEFIWSRSFMDQVFADIITFEQTSSTTKKLFKSSGGDIALFSIQVESIFSLYIQLTNLFKAHRKVIFYRIAFTSKLMPQLWKLMNQFGPKGNMIIYLEAAKQKDINKEPLVQVLKVFCESCSIVFL